MSNTAVFYGSTTGNTETSAKSIAKKLGAEIFDVSESPVDALAEHQNLVFGTSTWGIGDLQDDWEAFISEVESADLNGKTVALFGCGDSCSYPDSFVDGIGKIYNAIKDKGCKVIGAVNTDAYEYDASEAEIDGQFIGLALDEDNQGDMSEERINTWTEALKAEFA